MTVAPDLPFDPDIPSGGAAGKSSGRRARHGIAATFPPPGLPAGRRLVRVLVLAVWLVGPVASPAPSELRSFLSAGEEALRAGELVDAMRAFRAALELDAGSWEAHDGMARAWRASGDLESAERELRRAVGLAPPGAPPARHLADLLTTLPDPGRRHEGIRWLGENARDSVGIQLWVAGEARKAGDLITAQAALDRVLARQADNREALVEQILLSRDALEYDRAVELAKAFIERHPRHPQTYLQLGRIYQLQDRLEEAEGQYRKALELAPEDPTALTRLGEIRMIRGDLAGAAAALERAVAIAPDRYQGHYLLGQIYLRRGDREAAARELEAFRRIKDALRASNRLAGGAAMVDE